MSIRQRLRQNRGLRVVLALAVLALVGGIVVGVLAIDQRGEADQQAERGEPEAAGEAVEAEGASDEAGRANAEAERANPEAADAPEQAAAAPQEAEDATTDVARADATAFDSETRRLIANSAASVEDNRRLALLLAAEAYGRDPSVETVGALQRALVDAPDFLGYLGGGSNTYQQVVFSDIADHLVAVGDRFLERFDLRSGALNARTALPESSGVASLSPDGESAAVVLDATSLGLYHTPNGELRDVLEIADVASAALTAVAVASDGDQLATGHENGTVVVWDLASREPVLEIASHTLPIGLLQFSPDGSTLAAAVTSGLDQAAGEERFVRLWDPSTGGSLGAGLDPNVGDFELPTGASAVAFGRDGSTISIAGSWNIQTFDVATLDLIQTTLPPGLTDYSEEVSGFAIVDGSTVAVGLPDGRALVFEVGDESGRTLEPQVGDLLGVVGSPDGSRLALAGRQGIAVYSLDGTQLLAPASPSTAPNSDLSPDELRDLACRAASRNMTRTEWEEFGPADTNYRGTCRQFSIQGAGGS